MNQIINIPECTDNTFQKVTLPTLSLVERIANEPFNPLRLYCASNLQSIFSFTNFNETVKALKTIDETSLYLASICN